MVTSCWLGLDKINLLISRPLIPFIKRALYRAAAKIYAKQHNNDGEVSLLTFLTDLYRYLSSSFCHMKNGPVALKMF